jgi:23S rRNA (pseudouridine1915-N3)-methyltransferase
MQEYNYRLTMLKIKILSVGKFKDDWLENAIEIYTQRLTGKMQIEWAFAKDDKQLLQLLSNEPNVICLDPEGLMQTSEEFSLYLFKSLEKGGSRLSFVIGGAEGLPNTIKKQYPLISLSRLTFTHQMARLLLIEQIYRAMEIQKGTDYHK